MVQVAVFSLLLSAAVCNWQKVDVAVHIAHQLRDKLADFSISVMSGTESQLQLEKGS
jgi:hypothetical protein